ncbi:MAG TPA: hypothetical protein VK498_06285 [Ferruginibacter sp.]|nr:hypothetical protein [Ferruginibacter sp.]
MESIEKYYIEGKITASYSGFRRDDLGDSKHSINEIKDLLNAQVQSFNRIDNYDPRYKVVGNSYLHFDTLNGVLFKIKDKQYRTNLTNAFINDIKLSEHGKDGIYSFGKLEGIVTATIEKPITETVFPTITQYESSSEKRQFQSINNTSGALEDIDTISGKKINPKKKRSNWIENDATSWITGLAILLFLLIFIGKAILPLLFCIGIFLLIGLLSRYATTILSFIVVLLLIAGLLMWIFSTSALLRARTLPKHLDEQKETTKVDTKKNGSTNSFAVIHHRAWKDYDNQFYEADIIVNQNDYFEGKKYHTELSQNTYTNEKQFWYTLYQSISHHDEKLMPGLYTAFDSIGRSNQLNRERFANMIVSFVQDIPYTLIVDRDCDRYKMENPADVDIISNSGCFGPCVFGLQSPVEFMYNLKGDCDTRTVLLYTLLSHYDYDIAILNSVPYRHSMLGINLPVGGTSKSIKGKRYFFWETTATNFRPGILPVQTDNVDYWHFVLTSK